jgi:hypothetical protein
MCKSSDIGDGYLDLRALNAYSSISIPTLREHLKDPCTPLPHFKVKGKILIRKSEFDDWMNGFRADEADRLGQIVEDAINDLKG